MKQTTSQYRIALFILDSAISNYAINGFIDAHRGDVALVIASNPQRRNAGGIRRLLRHYRQSGLRFCLFLAYSFFIFPLLLNVRWYFRKLSGRTGGGLPIKRHCRHYGIDYRVCDNINDGSVCGLIRERRIDLIVTCFFDQILGADLIKAAHLGCLNIHPGLLPECRGVFPEFQAAAGKCADFGITIHCIDDATIDTGRILVKRIANVDEHKSLLTIGRKLLAAGLAALEEVLKEPGDRIANSVSQDTGAYYSYPVKDDIRKIIQRGYKLIGANAVLNDLFRC